jgi:hypothetical protein
MPVTWAKKQEKAFTTIHKLSFPYMKLLLVCNQRLQIQETLTYIGLGAHNYRAAFHQHQIDVLETGFGGFQTCFHFTEWTAQHTYHLILKAGFAKALQPGVEVGQVVNIVRDYPAGDGEWRPNTFCDLYDLHLLHVSSPPHHLGGLVNKTNSYMNIFLPYKKVFAITAPIPSDNEMLRNLRIEKYHPHIETADGIYFAYPCMWKKLNFYHLAVVAENYITGHQNMQAAQKNLNDELISIIQKL